MSLQITENTIWALMYLPQLNPIRHDDMTAKKKKKIHITISRSNRGEAIVLKERKRGLTSYTWNDHVNALSTVRSNNLYWSTINYLLSIKNILENI